LIFETSDILYLPATLNPRLRAPLSKSLEAPNLLSVAAGSGFAAALIERHRENEVGIYCIAYPLDWEHSSQVRRR
jgi:hypothetical protein